MTKAETNTAQAIQSGAIDITAFDAVGECEAGRPLALTGTDGVTATGVTLTVLGKHAAPITTWVGRIVSENMREQQASARKGKPADPRTLQEMRDTNIDGATVRVTGWSGPKQAFSPELLRAALVRNPHWVEQIVEFSDDIANFTNAPANS